MFGPRSRHSCGSHPHVLGHCPQGWPGQLRVSQPPNLAALLSTPWQGQKVRVVWGEGRGKHTHGLEGPDGGGGKGPPPEDKCHQGLQGPPDPSLLGLSRGIDKTVQGSLLPSSAGGRLGLRLCSYLQQGWGGAAVASEGTQGRRVSRQGQLTSQAGARGLEGRLGKQGPQVSLTAPPRLAPWTEVLPPAPGKPGGKKEGQGSRR